MFADLIPGLVTVQVHDISGLIDDMNNALYVMKLFRCWHILINTRKE